jgi:hypothetical protein
VLLDVDVAVGVVVAQKQFELVEHEAVLQLPVVCPVGM